MKYNEIKDPSKKYNKVIAQATSLYGLFSRKKKLRTIAFLKSKLNDENFEVEELASGLIFIGHLYQEIKDYESAAFYFNKGYSLGQDIAFPYDSSLKKVLKTFLKADQKDLYVYWRLDFIKRSFYDKEFNKLKNK